MTVQEKLDEFYMMNFEFTLTKESEPNMALANKELLTLGEEEINKYIKDNKVPHILNGLSKSTNLLRTENRGAQNDAKLVQNYFDTLIDPRKNQKTKDEEKQMLQINLIKKFNTSAENVSGFLQQTEEVAKKHLNKKEELRV